MAAPELRLNVTLDLASFRSQLGKLAQTAAAYYYPVNLIIDKKNFEAQLKALGKIKPVININDDQLIAARTRIGTLNKSLATLRRATATPIEIKVKYVEVGKPPAGGTAEIGRAVSGGVRGSQAIEGFSKQQLQNTRKMMVTAGMAVGQMGNLAKATSEEYRKSIVQGFTNSGQEAINGFAAGLKDASSKIGAIAAKVGEEGVRGIKDALGIASPSRVFKQIGEFSVDGLEIGFLNGLKDFKSKSVAEVKQIVALLRFELAKVSDISGPGGASMGSLRRQLVGRRAYTSPIGPLPVGSEAPYARGDRGQFGSSGYEPRMVSSPAGRAYPAAPNSFLGFSRGAGGYAQAPSQAPSRTPSSFLGFSQRATQLQQSAAGGAPPSPPTPPIPPSGGGRGGGSFGGMQFNMPKLPGAGIVQGLGTEFGFAAKQVLLFGTAYKALAFLTDFPSQVGTAVGQLQSFRNTLNAVSPSAQEAAQSSQFILDVVDKYNVPLQSARDGFTRLYASMQPAGFGGNEIRGLFLGISQAAATFGMSADKVDRVNYAFAQMASKGQVMSEELKGQLGDVLPGSMALFAEAAGFKGPQAITKFSKALEDGVYKGGAMKTLLTNVGIVMSKEFGPGAEGAAKTFQGSINRMQNSLKLFYETFEPVAVGFLNAVVTPMTSGIKTLTDGFNAFFTGAATKTSGGFAIAQELKDLKPSFDGILSNLKELIPSFQVLGKVILGVAKTLTVIAGNPIVGFLLKIYTNMLLVNGVFTLLGGRVLLGLISSLGAAIAKFIALNFAVASLQRTSVVANSTLAGTRLQMGLLSRGATGALGPIGLLTKALIGLARFSIILVGIEIVISGLAELDRLNKSLDKIAGFSSKEYTAEVKGLSKEDVNSRIIVNRRAQLSATKELKQFEGGLGKAKGLVTGRDEELRNRMVVLQTQELILESAKNNKSQAQLDKERTEKELAKIKLEGGDDGKAAEREAERQAKLQDKLANRDQQLAVDAANRQVALDQSTFDSRLRMSDAEYNHLRALQDDYFEREISGLDSIEARQKKHQQDLKAIENRRIDSIRKAELDAVKAVQDLRSASIKAAAVSGAPGAAKFGDTGRTFNAPGFVHGHVQNMDRGALKSDSTALVKSLLQQGVTPELSSGAKFDRSMSDAQIADLVGRGIAAHKQYASGAGAIDIFVPKGTSVPAPLSNVGNLGGAAGVTGTMPGGSQLMHLDPSSKSSSVGLATRSGAFAMGRREDKAEGNLAVEQQDAQNRAVEKLATIRNANNLALQQTITLVKQNIDSIFPLREQQLENDLLELRNNLESKGVSKQIIDMEVEKARRSKESTLAAEVYTKKIDESTAALERFNKMKTLTPEDKSEMARLTAEIDLYKKTLAGLPELQGLFNNELARTATLTTESSFESAMTSLKDRMKMAQAFTPGQELKTQIALDNPDLSPEQQQKLFDTTQATIKLEELKQKAKDTASVIGNAFGQAFKGISTGTMTAQEALAGMFKSVADHFTDMVAQMIAEYLKMQVIEGIMSIFKMIIPAAGGAGSFYGGGGGEALTQAGSFGGNAFSNAGGIEFGSFGVGSFAEGGRPPIGRPSLVGELGPELFVPSSSGTIIPADATEALLASRNALRSSATSGPTSAFEENRQMLDANASVSRERYIEKTLSSGASSTEIKYSRVGSGDLPFVTEADMLQASRTAAQEGARMGQQRTLAALKNNPGARRAIGI